MPVVTMCKSEQRIILYDMHFPDLIYCYGDSLGILLSHSKHILG